MLFKIPSATPSETVPYVSTIKYNLFTKTKEVVDNETIYVVNTFRTPNSQDADKYLAFIRTSISNNRKSINRGPFVVDLTKWGIPTITNTPGDLNLNAAQSINLDYTNIFHSDSVMTITYTAVSSNTNSATVRVNSRGHTFVIDAIASGASKVTLTATNHYGSISTGLEVNVS